MLKYIDDILVLIGCTLVLIGVYQVCPVATWFVAGGMCIIGGILVGIGEAKHDHP